MTTGVDGTEGEATGWADFGCFACLGEVSNRGAFDGVAAVEDEGQ